MFNYCWRNLSRTFFLALPLILAGLLWQNSLFSQQQDPKAIEGEIDLRQTDLSSSEVRLDGDWDFFWNQLTTTDQAASERQPFPGFWHQNRNGSGELYPRMGYASYQLKILLPKGHNRLGIRIPDFYGSYALFANGTLIAKEGRVATNADSAAPFWRTRVERLPELQDSLTLTLQLSNYHLIRSGSAKSLILADYKKLEAGWMLETAMDWLLAGCLLMGGLFFLGMFLLGTRDRAILFFSIFCIIYSLRMVGTGNYLLHTVLPNLPWQVSLRMEYFTLCAGGISFAYYLFYLYPKDINKWILRVFVILMAAYLLLSLFTPVLFFTALLPYLLVISLLFVFYCIYVFFRAAHFRRVGAQYAVWSNVVAVGIFATIILNYFGLLPVLRSVHTVGYIIFFFLQSLILSKRFSYTLVKARKDAEAGLKAKSDFLSTMSHEIRTPLNAVIGITELMKMEEMSQEEIQENVQLLSFSANNLLSIVNDILDFSKLEAQKISIEKLPFNIHEVLHSIIGLQQPVAENKNLSLELSYEPGIPIFLVGDPMRLTQILNNLLSNALKFTQQGKVHLDVRIIQKRDAEIRLSFRVSDTGIGIDKEKISLIFSAFSQADSSTARRFGGTGLGLSISNELLKLQDSSLEVSSEMGSGSVFSFTLAFGIVPEGAEDSGHVGLKTVQNRPRGVLLVEDNELNILFTQKRLESWSFPVSVARSGEEAIVQFDPSVHGIILMDLQMPDMDGFEATRRIRQIDPLVPIVAFTANVDEQAHRKAKQAGANEVMTKPFQPTLLKELLERLNG